MNFIKKSVLGLGMVASLSGCESIMGPTPENEMMSSEWSGTYNGHAHFNSLTTDDSTCGIELRIQDLSDNSIRVTFSLDSEYSVIPWYAQGGEVDNLSNFYRMTQSGPYILQTDLHKEGDSMYETLAADDLEGNRKWTLEDMVVHK